ncbi:integrase arm-type DNA-binding domain-containing protein [Gammaproteobacteria bacterium]|nr:integrase arm-type DNA-binding domain-containing protein [Gammaproteobacteria bacterium]
MANNNLLTAAFCHNTRDPKLHADGNGLYLVVSPGGGKSWILRTRHAGKRPEIGLGSFADVPLEGAREIAANVRKLARKGIDPRTWKKHLTDGKECHTGIPTFDQCIQQAMREISAELSNPKHIAQWTSTLQQYASPVIGTVPVDKIDLGHIEEILTPIWKTKTETASRLRGRVERVLTFAIVKGYRSPPNPAIWRGNLEMLLPNPSVVKKSRHFAALPYADVAVLMKRLSQKKTTVSKALALTILTTSRTQEIIGTRWSEFDLERCVWTVPANRMKVKKEHRVPLVPRVVDLLRSIPKHNDSLYLFPGFKGKAHISNLAMLKFLKQDMGYQDLTVHGFRSTFKEWAMKETSFQGELSEVQLAHTTRNTTQAAYERGDKLQQRRELLLAWTRYCGGQTG